MKKKNVILIIIIISVFLLGICTGLIILLTSKEEKGNNDEEKFTDTLLIDNGQTNYKIVIPKDCSNNIKFAANELITFFKEATDITLEVMTDENLEFSSEAHYLSISGTSLSKERRCCEI